MKPADLPCSTHPLVTLRPLERSDAPAWYAYLADPAVVEHTSWALRGIDDLQANFDDYASAQPASPMRLAVVLRDGGQLVGTIGFNAISPQHRTAEIAYDLAPAVWGHGVATSIVNAVVDWGFQRLGLLRIQATVLESNERSLRVLERCAFEREGYLRSYRQIRERSGNFWLYARLAGIP
ncbi:spermidine N(1)-acetyltransferase [Janthinobacterium sp. HH103]|uniref:GNAT family N-acetyltransferase n=1 Tax=unclassified Janthinobacterium TaxID=2610881 RepID=UPI000873BE50|nr:MULTISPECIES: GNAT family N-acetyltransferase [unclassified Janthinobacterium]OEZ70960.1 spermidine N(1)-acetyltransferase [Janthinobacterium sp. HH100]OEZ82357.1 spermidine N(1)-acetyltransferase [Janthinobacterium sp. HH103]QOU74451.1 Acetyltransferase (GNAT) domain protein [Janthinobacterium sp. HH102]